MVNLSDFSKGIAIAIFIAYLIAFIYAFCADRKRNKIRYIIQHDTARHKHIENIVHDILEKKEHTRSLFKKMVNSSKNGFLMGCMSGSISGDPSVILATGILFGAISPIVLVCDEFVPVSDKLSTKIV